MAHLHPDYIANLRASLVIFHEKASRFIQQYGALPVDGSKARHELGVHPDLDSVVTACNIGAQLIEYGGDHLSAFVKIITEPIEVISSWTCVRSMLESCALSAWLLDPDVDAQTRVGRTYALRYEGMLSELKYSKRSSNLQGNVATLEKRIEAVEQKALSFGFAPVVDKTNRRIGIGVKMPSATDMIALMLGEEKMYALLSAVNHGHVWAIRGLNYAPVNQPEDASFGSVAVKSFAKTVNVDGIALIGLSAAYAFARPLWNECRFFGWNALHCEELLEEVCDKLGASHAKRFWRDYTVPTGVTP